MFNALAFDEICHPVFEIGLFRAQRRLRDFKTSDEMVVLNHGSPFKSTEVRARCMLNAKHVSRSGSLLGRAFLQQPTVTLVGAGFSKTPCCLPNFSMICVSLTWPDWRGELSSSAECKWLKIRTATWQAANRFRRSVSLNQLLALLRGNYRIDETNSAIDRNASPDRDVPPCIAVMVPEGAVFTNTRFTARISGARRDR